MRKLVSGLFAFVLTLTPASAQNGLPGGPGSQIPNSNGTGGGGGGGNSGLTLATSNMTFAIATTGSDGNPCTTGSPCLTLQRAVNVASGYNWAGKYFPTITIADGTYANTQVLLPSLVNVNFGGVIVGNNTNITNVKLADAGTDWTIKVDSFGAWTVSGIDFTGTYGGIEIFENAILAVAVNGKINFGGTLVQGGILNGSTGQLYTNGGGVVISTDTSSMGPLLFSRGVAINDATSFVFTNPVVFTGSVVLLDAVMSFWAIDEATFTNHTNVSLTGGTAALSANNGAFVEADTNTLVDGAVLTRTNFPGGAVFTDQWSVYQPDQGLYLSAGITSISNATNIYLTNTDTGGKQFIFGSSGSTNGFGAGVFTFFNATDNRGLFTYNFTSAQDRLTFPNTMELGWDGSTGFAVPALIDTGISRSAAGVIDVNNGMPGSTAGQIKVAGVISKGTVPAGTTGSCSASGFVGGATAGKFTAPVCVAGTIILSGLPAAPNGYTCNAQDQTTPADFLRQTANTVSSVTFGATTAASDVIVFRCDGW